MKIDMVLLDMVMPDMDGLETLKQIKAKHPNIHVIMVSGVSEEAAQNTMEALNHGALDFIRKPSGNDLKSNIEQLKGELAPIFKSLELKTAFMVPTESSAPVIATPSNPAMSAPAAPVPIRQAPIPLFFNIVAIGVSTGGPNALNEVIPKLPADFPHPILMVQHMPPTFTAALAEDLNNKSNLRVVEADECMAVEPGKVYIAKGGYHMVVRKDGSSVFIRLTQSPPENSCRPAVDVLFRSIADVYGGKGILGVIMTGMGADGLAGIKTMKRKGCYCLTQTKESCVVYGMPRAVDEAGLSDRQVPLPQLAAAIDSIARGRKT